jgi:protein-S-isoprenylcysteine O-methyltransferase Ste14
VSTTSLEQEDREQPALPSPSWYRHRGALFGLSIWVGCLVGYLLAALLHLPRLPIFALVEQRYGPAGMRVVFAAALAVSAVGFWLRLWGAGYLASAVVWSRQAQAERLVVAGPFRHTRNPLYLGNLLLFTAFGVLVAPAAAVLLVVAGLLALQACIAHEEKVLGRRFGAAFDAYCQQVPRLWPRLVPTARRSEHQFVGAEALRSELGIAFWVLGWVLLLVGGRRWEWLFWVFLLAGLLWPRLFRRAIAV